MCENVGVEAADEVRLPLSRLRRADPYAGQGVGDQTNRDAAGASGRELGSFVVVERVAVEDDLSLDPSGAAVCLALLGRHAASLLPFAALLRERLHDSRARREPVG